VTPVVDVALRFEISDLYARYVEALDDGDLEAWPELFTETCTYQAVSAENHERGLPLATIRCESRGMLRDRVQAIRETAMYEPRRLRHVVGPLRVREVESGALAVGASYAVFETLPDALTRVFNVGRYDDVVVRDGEALRFRLKCCVYDSDLVPNSLVLPI
jgi:salicylate 5-hydroxylase small subunit